MSLQEKNEDNQSKKTFTQIAIKIEKQIKNLCIEKFTESPGKKLNHFLKKQRFLADIIYFSIGRRTEKYGRKSFAWMRMISTPSKNYYKRKNLTYENFTSFF